MKLKRYIIFALAALFAASVLFIGTGCFRREPVNNSNQNGADTLPLPALEETLSPTQPPAVSPEVELNLIGDSDIIQSSTVLPQYQEYYNRNGDLVGWLNIDNTFIDYPVMQNLEKPDYYITHGFDGEECSDGLPFIHEKCSVGISNNTVICGHRLNNQMLFNDLIRYSELSFWQQHQTVFFDTIWCQGVYEVFAVFYYSNSDPSLLDDNINMNPAAFDEYVKTCYTRRLYDTGVAATYGDMLLTITALDCTRPSECIVVVARKVVE